MKVLSVDIGGTHVKILTTGKETARKFASGPTLTPDEMVREVQKLAGDWKYDVVAIGYPGLVVGGRPTLEPHNLGRGWVGFDYEHAFGRPVRIINDAAMQALGSYKRGTMLFLGFGTGLGSALVVAGGVVVPMELGHLSYRKATFEDYVGLRGLKRLGKRKWRKHVSRGISRLIEALHADDIVLGGGNARILKKLPAGCRLGDNAYAFVGGFRLWEDQELRGNSQQAERNKKAVREIEGAQPWHQHAS